MRMFRRLLPLLALLLAGCDVAGLSQPTPPPVIILATQAPLGPTSPATQAPAATLPPDATQAPDATPADPNAPPATAAPGATPAARGTITMAFDSFPTYFPAVVMQTRGLLQQRGYDLQLVPLGLNGVDFPEAQRYEKLRSGEWDVLATTLNSFARSASPEVGAITAVVDESAGVDKIVAREEIATLNDLRGRRIAYSEGSVSEYLLYYALGLAGLGPQDVQLAPQPSAADAVAAYTGGQADAVVAWEPTIGPAEQQAGSKVLVASDQLRAVLDVLVTGRPALDGKADAVQAFHAAWYDALRLVIDAPDQAEQAIIDWGNSDWTGIAAPGDLRASLEGIAQATLNANQIAFQQPQLLASRLSEARGVWERVGQIPPQADPALLVDGRFTQAAAQDPQLFTSQAPVDSSFLLTARVSLPQLSEQQQQEAQEVVQLPLEKIDFLPESTRLTDQARNDLLNQVLPVLRSSRLYLRIEGSSAWPGPAGRYTQENIRAFAEERATSVATFLSQQGIDPNRLLIGTLDPKFPNSLNEAELVQDRIVRFTLISTGGR
ncbi:MAG TPA: ABC transporter substrate-binding protein [Roseiflexaceae bacterium]|nr:ABC transporter substrate-binding protein [Roseiflexaceae bacterium]